jgi:rare lipoprotein A (peptidoglycan hydrolase)
MPMFRHGRHGAAAGLLVTGTTLLVAVQQVIGGVAAAQTEAVVDVHNLQPLPEAMSPVAATNVDAAVMSGQFEELVKPTPVPTLAPTRAPTAAPTPEPTRPVVFERGIASTYGEGDGFEGNRTACGQIFHTSVVQIAHKSLPCGTLVRVEDADTGRSIDAEVTDRGPYVPGRIVDLSWGAFKQLDPTGPGLLRVNVYLLNQ